MALQIGLPVRLSHTMVVSRWLVMPIESISSGETLLETIASTMTPS